MPWLALFAGGVLLGYLMGEFVLGQMCGVRGCRLVHRFNAYGAYYDLREVGVYQCSRCKEISTGAPQQ